jgi:hypothetical protein
MGYLLPPAMPLGPADGHPFPPISFYSFASTFLEILQLAIQNLLLGVFAFWLLLLLALGAVRVVGFRMGGGVGREGCIGLHVSLRLIRYAAGLKECDMKTFAVSEIVR